MDRYIIVRVPRDRLLGVELETFLLVDTVGLVNGLPPALDGSTSMLSLIAKRDELNAAV